MVQYPAQLRNASRRMIQCVIARQMYNTRPLNRSQGPILAQSIASSQLLIRGNLITYVNIHDRRIAGCLHTAVSLQQQSSRGDSPVVPFILSDIGEGISEVTIKEWFVKVGDRVRQFDPICEVQSDKASVTITSRYDGVVVKLHHQVEALAAVGKPLIDIQLDESDKSFAGGVGNNGVAMTTSDPRAFSSPPGPSEDSKKGQVLATPAVRRMAAEMQVPLTEVTGTGKGNRVLKDDIFAYLDRQQRVHVSGPSTARVISTSATAAPIDLTDTSQVLPLKRQLEAKTAPISGYTRTMIKTMTTSLQIPHFGYKDEINLTTLVSLRKEMAEEAKQYGVKLSYVPFFVKAASLALYQYPILNSSLSESKDQIIYKAEHNIGLAVDTSIGLIVPNIKNCQNKSILEIGAELSRLQSAANAGQVSADDLSGGTFALSNIGSIGGTYTFPVILPPNVCIGALGRIRKVPRYLEDDTIVPAHVLEISWSADHRIIDGATIARFSNVYKRYLEKPHLLLMHLQ